MNLPVLCGIFADAIVGGAVQLRDEVEKYKVGAPARVGLVAPNDVVVPAGNTGLDPSQTSFFQVCR